jgi:uncharacterized delta-60 repeat protein
VVLRTAAIALLLLVFSPASAAADGAPDRSFGKGGSLSYAPQRFSGAAGVAVDAQGRILVAATLDDGSLLRTRAALLRLLPDGTLDPAFGSGGVASIAPPAPYTTSRAEALALDAQGRMVVAGEVDDDVPAVARLLPDGTLDPAFASGGILVARGEYGGLPGWWRSVAIAGSSIVLAGAVDSGPPFGSGLGAIAVLARIRDNGVPDPAFGNGGFLELPIPGVSYASTHAAAIDNRGRIVLGLWRATTAAFPGDVAAAVVRITAAGSVDASFGSGGLVLLGALKGSGPSLSLTATGEIVAIGGWTARAGAGTTVVVRLHPSGQLDATFASGGELASSGAPPEAGILDCQGNLLVSGAGGVKRFGPDGRLDPTFHGAGIPPVAVGDTTAAAGLGLLALTSTGALVLAGTASDGPSTIGGSTQVGHSSIAVARIASACPTADARPPAVTLTCTAGCRRVMGGALDDPVGRGIRRVLLGVVRITGTRCAAWGGKRFASVPCRQASARLVAVRVVRGAFHTPLLGAGRFVVRAVAIDGAGNRSRLAVRRLTRQNQ